MTFAEKLKDARKQLKMTRDDLADAAGICKRTIAYYELDGKMPRSRQTVEAIARALHTDPASLLDENAKCVLKTEDVYGAQGAKQAQKLVSQIRSLYAGGTLKEADMDAMMLAIQDAYWIARKKAADKKAGAVVDDKQGD